MPDHAGAADAPFVATVEGQQRPGDPNRLADAQPVGGTGEEGGDLVGGELCSRGPGERCLRVGRDAAGQLLQGQVVDALDLVVLRPGRRRRLFRRRAEHLDGGTTQKIGLNADQGALVLGLAVFGPPAGIAAGR